MKDFSTIGVILVFFLALVMVDSITQSNNKDRDLKKQEVEMQWKLDSTDKAERREMDKYLETLRLKLENENRR